MFKDNHPYYGFSSIRILTISLIVISTSVKLLNAQSMPYDTTHVWLTGISFSEQELVQRRQQLFDLLHDGEVAVFLASCESGESGRNWVEHSWSNNIYYFVGEDRSAVALVLSKTPLTINGITSQVVFFRSAMPVFDSSSWWHIPNWEAEHNINVIVDSTNSWLSILQSAQGISFRKFYISHISQQWPIESSKRENFSLLSEIGNVGNADSLVNLISSKKSPVEMLRILAALDITKQAHSETIRYGRFGQYQQRDFQLRAVFEYNLTSRGADRSNSFCELYSGLPQIGKRSVDDDFKLMKWTDFVVIYGGASILGYSVPIARTFPVSGEFTSAQRFVYEAVASAVDSGIHYCKPGMKVAEVRRRLIERLRVKLIDLGIAQDSTSAIAYMFPEAVFSVGRNLKCIDQDGSTLESGMVVAINAGLSIPSGSNCPPKWWNMKIRLQDVVAISSTGYVDLSSGLIRSVDAIVNHMKGKP